MPFLIFVSFKKIFNVECFDTGVNKIEVIYLVKREKIKYV